MGEFAVTGLGQEFPPIRRRYFSFGGLLPL